MTRPSRIWIIALLAVYLALGVGFAVRTAAWQAPDEPAHYNYVAQVAAQGCCPIIEVGDWDSAYLEELKAARFRPDLLGDLPAIQYEDHQPPLYYLLASFVFRLTDGSLLALRLLSVLLGAGVVLAAYAVGRVLLPNEAPIALGAAAFVAFLPQHLAVLASVNNDALAELVVGLTLLGTVAYIKADVKADHRGRRVPPWLLGVLVGLGLLTKLSTLFLVGLVPLAILGRWWISGSTKSVPSLLRSLVAFGVPALALALIWWVRNVGVYGVPDIFGLGAHDLVVTDQARTASLIAEIGFGGYLSRAVETTFNSFWGQFGWMGLPLQPWMYTILLVFSVVAVLGLLINIVTQYGRTSPVQRLAWWILGLVVLFGFAQFVYYNLEFLQLQGRYLYPALIPVGLGVAVGLNAWPRLIVRSSAEMSARFAPAVLALLAVFDAYLLWRVIPGLAP